MQYNNFSGYLQNLKYTLYCLTTTCLRSPLQKEKQSLWKYNKLKKRDLAI